MDRIRELLENLNTLSPEEMAELEGLINSTFDEMDSAETAPTAESVGLMEELVNAGEATRGEIVRREEEAAAAAAAAEEIRGRMHKLRNPEKAEDEPAPETESTDAEGGAPAATGEAPAEGTAPAAGTEGIAATAGAPRGTTGTNMVQRMAAMNGHAEGSPDQTEQERYTVSIVASAGVPRFAPGQTLTSDMELAEAMSEKLRRLQSSHDFTSSIVASASWEYPEDRRLGDDAAVNTRILNDICGIGGKRYDRQTGALVATGGVCLPVNVDYAVPTWSTADRPLRDALPGFQATRGGIRFVSPPDIGVPDLQGGTASGAGLSVTVWTEATDASPGAATKPVWTVACGTEQLVYVNAIPTRVKFGNMQSRFAPEQIAANTQQAIAISAREAELELLTLMYQQTKQVLPHQALGAARDILSSVDLLVQQYRYSHRIPETASLIAVFPAWAKGVIRADLLREIGHDNAGSQNVLAITDAQIEDWFSARGVTIIWTLDGLQAGTYGTGGQAITNQYFPLVTAGAQPQWPGQSSDAAFMVAWLLYVEGSFQFLDGGRLDLGVVRDSVLDATNDYETFVETFEGLAFRGIEAYQVQSLVLPNGASGATSTNYHE